MYQRAEDALREGGRLYLNVLISWWSHTRGGWIASNKIIVRNHRLMNLLEAEGIQRWTWTLAVERWLASVDVALWGRIRGKSLQICTSNEKYFEPEVYDAMAPHWRDEVLALYGEDVPKAWAAWKRWHDTDTARAKSSKQEYMHAFRACIATVTEDRASIPTRRAHVWRGLNESQLVTLAMLDCAMNGHLVSDKATAQLSRLMRKAHETKQMVDRLKAQGGSVG